MIQGWEWIIILVIVIVIFGAGRIGKIMGEVGKGVSSFRKGLREGSNDDSPDGNDIGGDAA